MGNAERQLDYQLERLIAMWRRIDSSDTRRLSMVEKLVELIDLTLQVWDEGDDEVSRLSQALDRVWDEVELRRHGYSGLTAYPLAITTGPDGNILRVNRQLERVLGYRSAEMVGRSLSSFVDDDSQKAVAGVVAAPYGAQQAGAFDVALHGADGVVRKFKATVSASNDADSELLGVYWWLLPGGATPQESADLLDTQERLRATFEQAAVAMAHLTLDGDWVRVNEAMCTLVGVDGDTLLTKPFHAYLHPDDREIDEERSAELLRGDIASYALEVRFRAHDDAEPNWVRETVSLLRAEDGEPAYRVVVLEDISRRRKAEEALIVALDRARDGARVGQNITVAQAIPDVFDALMDSARLSGARHALLLRFERPWALNELPPDRMSVLAVWPEGEQHPAHVGDQHLTHIYELGSLINGSKPISVEGVADDPRLTANLRALLASLGETALLFPLMAKGERYGLLGIGFPQGESFSDDDLRYITEAVRQASAAIYTMLLLTGEEAARREAERANAMKMKLLATISHELRTPLTSIKGFASTLLADDVEWEPEMQRDFIVTINDEADKLGDLIDQLLDLSRLEAGTLRINMTRTTFDDVLDIVMPQLAMLAGEHVLHIALCDGEQAIYADPQRVAQVVANLVNNAAKYSPAGTRISVSCEADHGYVRLNVSDEGPGIAPDDRERLFEAFVQGDARKARSRPGAGLGLAISRGIVAAHGGRIWVEDNGGLGTTVSFTLPEFHLRKG